MNLNAPASLRNHLLAQRGQVSLELLGLIPLLLLVLLVILQLGVAVYAAQQADGAARIAARADTEGLNGAALGADALDSWLRDGSTVAVSAGHASVRVLVPGVLNLFHPLYVSRTADMPVRR
ncbi:TadE/TadG family type IV pilus assembly protein [Kitasatospora sp. NPDC059571]|uniref:TadE/TadG family type IV pilus assembly protein n=1 Tax=Kitasatospora sp. NPDC059571 TaxID=3346871 RepID=UPI003683287D